MSDFLSTFAISFSINGPIFVVLALGFILKRYQQIHDNFIDGGSRLVFNIALPSLLFISTHTSDINDSAIFH